MKNRMYEDKGVKAGLTVVAVALALCIFAQSASAVHISVLPSSQTVSSGENFTVDIYVDPEGSAVAGVDYILIFNNTLLNGTLLTEGTFFDGFTTDDTYGEGINNTAGWVDYGELIWPITGDGVTTPNTLTTITFQAIAEHGIDELYFNKVTVSDPGGIKIPANVSSGDVKIVEGDLVISNIWAHGHNNSICYCITNTGNGTAPAGHNTTLYIDGAEKVHDEVPVALAQNASYAGCFNYSWAFTPLEDNITVCADNDNIIVESNESNNCFTIIVSGHCGDVNNDGFVTTTDGVIVYKHYFHPEEYPLANEWAADVNHDGHITTTDGVIIYKHYFHPEEYLLECK